jgi:hypothetical protein
VAASLVGMRTSVFLCDLCKSQLSFACSYLLRKCQKQKFTIRGMFWLSPSNIPTLSDVT